MYISHSNFNRYTFIQARLQLFTLDYFILINYPYINFYFFPLLNFFLLLISYFIRVILLIIVLSFWVFFFLFFLSLISYFLLLIQFLTFSFPIFRLNLRIVLFFSLQFLFHDQKNKKLFIQPIFHLL